MFLDHDNIKMFAHFLYRSTRGFYTINIKSGNFKIECNVNKHDKNTMPFLIQCFSGNKFTYINVTIVIPIIPVDELFFHRYGSKHFK